MTRGGKERKGSDECNFRLAYRNAITGAVVVVVVVVAPGA